MTGQPNAVDRHGWPICGCGCGLSTGGGRRVNTETGMSTPTGPPATAARIAELEREVRVWKFNAEGWERQNSETRRNMARHAAGDRATLSRVWGLINRDRKTVRMEDLREALNSHVSTVDRGRTEREAKHDG